MVKFGSKNTRKKTKKLRKLKKYRKIAEVEFMPDTEIFDDIVYSYDTLSARMRELAYLNKGITISLTDEEKR